VHHTRIAVRLFDPKVVANAGRGFYGAVGSRCKGMERNGAVKHVSVHTLRSQQPIHIQTKPKPVHRSSARAAYRAESSIKLNVIVSWGQICPDRIVLAPLLAPSCLIWGNNNGAVVDCGFFRFGCSLPGLDAARHGYYPALVSLCLGNSISGRSDCNHVQTAKKIPGLHKYEVIQGSRRHHARPR
jgi:hypothetical protein